MTSRVASPNPFPIIGMLAWRELIRFARQRHRVIGALGIHSDRPERFQGRDAEFLKLSADLVAIAIEDARANEEIEALMRERTQFMLEVAHNLRAPLGAALNMQGVLREGYLGEINEKQREFLEKIDLRLRAQFRHERLPRLVGGLSAPSKMPGPSYSTSAFDCQTGSRLRDVAGSVCAKCYARKGLPDGLRSLFAKRSGKIW